jgi:hypothetical protein
LKIGTYEIPDLRLYPTLVEATKLIYEKYSAEEVQDMLIVAKLLGHQTSNSGAFLRKLACLRAYGLIEARGVKVTEIGKKLTFPTSEQEKNEALKQAILHIPLWKEFFSKWGATLPNGNFWVDLAKITGLEAPKAQSVVETVRKAYLDDVRYLSVSGATEMETKIIPIQPSVDSETFSFPNNVKVVLPKENMKEAWRKTKQMIDIYLGEKKES